MTAPLQLHFDGALLEPKAAAFLMDVYRVLEQRQLEQHALLPAEHAHALARAQELLQPELEPLGAEPPAALGRELALGARQRDERRLRAAPGEQRGRAIGIA